MGKVMGSRIHSATGTPAAGLGLENDWAMDDDSGEVWEKTASCWGSRGSFKGETVAQGPATAAEGALRMETGTATGCTIVLQNTHKLVFIRGTYKKGSSSGYIITITTQTIITAAVLTAMGVIGGVGLWCFKFVERDKRQTRELAAILEEQTIIGFCVLACLKGLKSRAAMER